MRSLSVVSAPGAVPFQIEETPAAVELSRAALRARIDKSTGLVSFADLSGNTKRANFSGTMARRTGAEGTLPEWSNSAP